MEVGVGVDAENELNVCLGVPFIIPLPTQLPLPLSSLLE